MCDRNDPRAGHRRDEEIGPARSWRCRLPTGVKWGFAAKYQSDTKYVVCNADEGDPGAFMDRAVLEGDPHSVLEAMAIGGYAIGGGNGPSTSVPNIPWPSNACRSPSLRPKRWAFWATTSSAPTSASTSN
ncbi:MAG: hypothetical protein R2940_06525 [Syntrophotaleaceae bacterium]